MQFFGFSVGDWTALITIFATFISLTSFFAKKFIIEPLMAQINNLIKSMNELSRNFKAQSHRHDKHLTKQDDRMDKMDVQLENHDTRLSNLERETEKDDKK